MVMEHDFWNFVIQSWNLTNLYKINSFWVTAKKLSSDLESLHFLAFSAKRRKFKIGERDGHGKLKNGHEKVMEK